MSIDELRLLLDQVPDTREIVLRRRERWSAEHDAWRDAHDEAAGAYRALAARSAPARRTPPTAPPRTARTRRRTRSPRSDARCHTRARPSPSRRPRAAASARARRPSSLRCAKTSRPGPTQCAHARANASARSLRRPRSAGTGCRRTGNGGRRASTRPSSATAPAPGSGERARDEVARRVGDRDGQLVERGRDAARSPRASPSGSAQRSQPDARGSIVQRRGRRVRELAELRGRRRRPRARRGRAGARAAAARARAPSRTAAQPARRARARRRRAAASAPVTAARRDAHRRAGAARPPAAARCEIAGAAGGASARRRLRRRRPAPPAGDERAQLGAAVRRADPPALARLVASPARATSIARLSAAKRGGRRAAPNGRELGVHVRRPGLDLAVLGRRVQVQVLAHEALVVGAPAHEVGRDADDVPVRGELARVVGIQAQRAPAHLLHRDAGGGDREVDEAVDRRAVPALAEQRARADRATPRGAALEQRAWRGRPTRAAPTPRRWSAARRARRRARPPSPAAR